METVNYELPSLPILTVEQAEKLKNNSFVVSHRKGEEIFTQERPISHLMFLSQGLVKIYKSDKKKHNVIIKLVVPNQYIGMFSLFYDTRYHFSAAALEDCEIIYINTQIVHELIMENGHFSLQLIKQFSSDGIHLMNKLTYYPQKQVAGRIAEVMLLFANEIYKNEQFTLPLSRQELADLVFSTKESVSRTLTEFKNDRMIDINDRQIHLKSIDLLNMLSKLG
jgi:CRP-like cAMP-binding protein